MTYFYQRWERLRWGPEQGTQLSMFDCEGSKPQNPQQQWSVSTARVHFVLPSIETTGTDVSTMIM